MLYRHGQCSVSDKRRRTGQHMKASHAKRIEVAARIERASFNLLGTHVKRRAHGNADLRQIDSPCPVARESCQTEISDFHFTRPREHDVLWLDVAMDDAAFGCFL